MRQQLTNEMRGWLNDYDAEDVTLREMLQQFGREFYLNAVVAARLAMEWSRDKVRPTS